ncbi:rhodanese-like domain-containing protein [Thioflexithrix psekupsensis]|uniref:Rhodanese domain-containing protein n=1 Tax=Thioflexithrix psekupsensis TaxID=1570016 RepID=A0A251XB38_9GAMM|nr:rhodanese-like domain-containing protein [Thioflexithrix psekupsensis]OUD15652.1 hypothetical protein TPSD3_03795 [Thioflexithrix psekupsensis]
MEQYIEFIGNHPILFLALMIISGFLTWSLLGNSAKGAKPVNPNEATLLINHDDAVVLDVREEGEYGSGHIIDSLHIPLGQLASKISQLTAHQSRPIIAVCASGQRSAQACGILKQNGFEQLYNLRGGLMAWQNNGLPLTKGRKDKPNLNKKNRQKTKEDSETPSTDTQPS